MTRESVIATARERTADFVTDLLSHPQALRGPLLRGSVVADFEALVARRWGYRHCLAMSNATTALLTLAGALQVKGREIIAAPQSWPGTYGPFKLFGAQLRLGEADAAGNLKPASLHKYITPQTCAVLAVDWKGQAHDAAAMRRFSNEHGLIYIADTGQPLVGGSCADAQVVSFGPGKPWCLGEGGALLTSSTTLYERCLALSQHPERCLAEDIPDESETICLNGRIHPLAAILGYCLLGMRTPA